jgi:RND family efflux transporter MFP subunit
MRLVVLIFIFILSVMSASNAENSVSNDDNSASNVENSVSNEEIRDARALVTATETVTISSELAARVEKINFLLGDAFKKGETLISFDCALYKAQKDVIQSNYDSANIQLENDKQLLEMRSIGKLQYQLSVSALKKAEAELKIAKLNVNRCEIVAPYDGKVMKVGTSVFASIEQRQPLMAIVGDGLLEADIVVSSNWLKWLKKGHLIKIIIDETGETLDAKVIKLGATVDAVSQTIELKAQFNKKYETLIPGMSGIAKF